MDTPHIFTTPSGDEMVIMTKAAYDALLDAADEAAEDAADVAIYDERKAALAAGTDMVLPPALSELISKGHTRVAALRKLWRPENRGAPMTQIDVAQRLGISQAYMSALEAGDRRITPDLARKLSELYDVPVEWVAD